MMRTRLSPDDRRAQLLAVGSELFAERPYDAVRIEDVADRAGVSRGLLYRYFPTKRELFRALVAEAVEQLLLVTEPDEALPLDRRITAALDGYVAHVEAHAGAVRAVAAGLANGDAELRKMIGESDRRQEDRIVAQLVEAGAPAGPVLRVSVRGWLHLTRALTIDWLDTHEVSRDELRDICAHALRALAGRDT